MPFYELFAVAKPALGKAAIGSMMKAVASKVMEQGGVVTDIRAYGQRKLAFDLRLPNLRFSEVGAPPPPHPPPPPPPAGTPAPPPVPTLPAPASRPHPAPPPSPPLQAAMWQINFAAKPETLPDLDHILRVDERMLRWLVLKRRPYLPLPTPHRVSRMATAVQAPLEQQASAAGRSA